MEETRTLGEREGGRKEEDQACDGLAPGRKPQHVFTGAEQGCPSFAGSPGVGADSTAPAAHAMFRYRPLSGSFRNSSYLHGPPRHQLLLCPVEREERESQKGEMFVQLVRGVTSL